MANPNHSAVSLESVRPPDVVIICGLSLDERSGRRRRGICASGFDGPQS